MMSHSISAFVVFSCLCLVLSFAANPDDYNPVSLRTYAKRGTLYTSAAYPRIANNNNPGQWQPAVARKLKDDFFQDLTTAESKLDNIRNVNKGITRKQLTDTKLDFKKMTYTLDNADEANFVSDTYSAAALLQKTEKFTFDNRETVTIVYDDTMEVGIKNDGLNAIRQGLALLNKLQIYPRVNSGIPITIEYAKWKNEYVINPSTNAMNTGAQRMADNEAFHFQDTRGVGGAKIIHTPVFLHLKQGGLTDSEGDPSGETIGDRVLIKFVKNAYTLTKWCTNLRVLRAKYTVVHEMMHVLHRINSVDLFWEIRPFSQMKFADNQQVMKLASQVSEYATKREAPVLEVFAELGTWMVARLNGDLDGDIDTYFKQAWAEYGGTGVKAWPAVYNKVLLEVQETESKVANGKSRTSVPFADKWQAVYVRGCSAPAPSFLEDSENKKIKMLMKQRKNVMSPN